MKRTTIVILVALAASMFLGLGIKSVYGATPFTKTTMLRTTFSSGLSHVLPPPPDPNPRTTYLP
jgi:hypothetical protein